MTAAKKTAGWLVLTEISVLGTWMLRAVKIPVGSVLTGEKSP